MKSIWELGVGSWEFDLCRLGDRRNRAIIIAVLPANVRADQTSNGVTWGMVRASLTRPYPVTWPVVTLLALVPWYIFIGACGMCRPGRALDLIHQAALHPGRRRRLRARVRCVRRVSQVIFP